MPSGGDRQAGGAEVGRITPGSAAGVFGALSMDPAARKLFLLS